MHINLLSQSPAQNGLTLIVKQSLIWECMECSTSSILVQQCILQFEKCEQPTWKNNKTVRWAEFVRARFVSLDIWWRRWSTLSIAVVVFITAMHVTLKSNQIVVRSVDSVTHYVSHLIATIFNPTILSCMGVNGAIYVFGENFVDVARIESVSKVFVVCTINRDIFAIFLHFRITCKAFDCVHCNKTNMLMHVIQHYLEG